MKLAYTISRPMPRIRLMSVAMAIRPDDFNICDIPAILGSARPGPKGKTETAGPPPWQGRAGRVLKSVKALKR
jgi:hypothetical protein